MAARHTGSVIEKLEDGKVVVYVIRKKDKLFYWQRGYNAFESGKWIVAFGQCNSWQRKAYKAGYETARLYSYATHDNPTDYQLDKLKSIIKG